VRLRRSRNWIYPLGGLDDDRGGILRGSGAAFSYGDKDEIGNDIPYNCLLVEMLMNRRCNGQGSTHKGDQSRRTHFGDRLNCCGC